MTLKKLNLNDKDKSLCFYFTMNHRQAFRDKYMPKATGRYYKTRFYQLGPALADNVCMLGGRSIGKSYDLEFSILQTMITKPNTESLLSAFRKTHIKDREERVIGYFNQIPYFKSFLLGANRSIRESVSRSPIYSFKLRNGHEHYGISVGDDPAAVMIQGHHPCLHPEQNVRLADGKTMQIRHIISKINRGEKVWVKSYDKINKKIIDSEVTDGWKTPIGDKKILRIVLEDYSNCLVTNNHKVYTEKDGKCILKRADELKINEDYVLTSDNENRLLSKKVIKIKKGRETQKVCDITVKGTKNYITGTMIVSNCYRFLEEVQFYPTPAWEKWQSTQDPKGSVDRYFGTCDGRVESPFRKMDSVIEKFKHARFHVPRLLDPYFDQERKRDLIESLGGETSNEYLQQCLPPDSLIETPFGRVAIEKIKVDDLVLTHTGKFRKVKKIFKRKYEGNLIVVNNKLKVTPEHPILMLRPHPCYPGEFRRKCKPDCKRQKREKCIKQYYKKYKIVWQKASHINIGDIVFRPKMFLHKKEPFIDISKEKYIKHTKKFFKHIIKFDKYLGWIIGCYLANGCVVRNNSIQISFAKDDKDVADKLIIAMKKCFGRIPKIKCFNTYYKVILDSKPSANFLLTLCGQYADKKYLKFDFYNLTEDFVKELLISYIKCDGHIRKKENRLSSITVSKKLAEQLVLLFSIFNINVHEYYTSSTIRKIYKNKKFSICKPFITLNINGESARRVLKNIFQYKIKDIINKNHSYQTDYLEYKVITKQEEQYKGFVYNLEVEKDETYVSNYIVHNCLALWGEPVWGVWDEQAINDCIDKKESSKYPGLLVNKMNVVEVTAKSYQDSTPAFALAQMLPLPEKGLDVILGIDAGYTSPTMVLPFFWYENKWQLRSRIVLKDKIIPDDQADLIDYIADFYDAGIICIDCSSGEGRAPATSLANPNNPKYKDKKYDERVLMLEFQQNMIMQYKADGEEIKEKVKAGTTTVLRQMFARHQFLIYNDEDLLGEFNREAKRKTVTGETILTPDNVHIPEAFRCFAYGYHEKYGGISKPKRKPKYAFVYPIFDPGVSIFGRG